MAIRLRPMPDSQLPARRLGAGAQGLFASPSMLASPLSHPSELRHHPCLRLHARGGKPARWTLTRGDEDVVEGEEGVGGWSARVMTANLGNGAGFMDTSELFSYDPRRQTGAALYRQKLTWMFACRFRSPCT